MQDQQPCPHCGQNIARYKVIFNHVRVSAALKAYQWATRNKTNEVHVKNLQLTNAEYTCFADLVLFGLLYRHADMKRGEYGVPRDRILKFWKGQATVAAYVWRSPMKTEDDIPDHELSQERINIRQIPKLADIIAKYGETMTEYERGI